MCTGLPRSTVGREKSITRRDGLHGSLRDETKALTIGSPPQNRDSTT